VDEWFSDFADVLGIEDVRVIVQAHTHAMLYMPWKADKTLIECGCLCKQQGYQFAPKISGRPQRRGYVTLIQNLHSDGQVPTYRTDVNSIRLVRLD